MEALLKKRNLDKICALILDDFPSKSFVQIIYKLIVEETNLRIYFKRRYNQIKRMPGANKIYQKTNLRMLIPII